MWTLIFKIYLIGVLCNIGASVIFLILTRKAVIISDVFPTTIMRTLATLTIFYSFVLPYVFFIHLLINKFYVKRLFEILPKLAAIALNDALKVRGVKAPEELSQEDLTMVLNFALIIAYRKKDAAIQEILTNGTIPELEKYLKLHPPVEIN